MRGWLDGRLSSERGTSATAPLPRVTPAANETAAATVADPETAAAVAAAAFAVTHTPSATAATDLVAIAVFVERGDV